MVGLHSSRLSGLTSSFRRRERSFERDKTATKFSNHCFVLLQFLTWNYLLDKENRPQTAISFLKILENKKRTTNSFMSLHARASRANVYLVLNLFASCACLQKYSIQHNQLYAPIQTNPTPSQPHPHLRNPPTHISTPNMDPPWLGIPKATYQPNRPSDENPNDIEQQAGSTAASHNNSPSGQNSVRTRVFSGLLMLTVIAVIVIILVTSGHHPKPGRIHRAKTSKHH